MASALTCPVCHLLCNVLFRCVCKCVCDARSCPVRPARPCPCLPGPARACPVRACPCAAVGERIHAARSTWRQPGIRRRLRLGRWQARLDAPNASAAPDAAQPGSSLRNSPRTDYSRSSDPSRRTQMATRGVAERTRVTGPRPLSSAKPRGVFRFPRAVHRARRGTASLFNTQ